MTDADRAALIRHGLSEHGRVLDAMLRKRHGAGGQPLHIAVHMANCAWWVVAGQHLADEAEERAGRW